MFLAPNLQTVDKGADLGVVVLDRERRPVVNVAPVTFLYGVDLDDQVLPRDRFVRYDELSSYRVSADDLGQGRSTR